MVLEKLKSSRTTMYDMEALVIIDKYMDKRHENFSKSVNYLIKQADYLKRKVDYLRNEVEINAKKADIIERGTNKDI